jgi:predicted RNA-binding protein YlqC (UPF0109 family)
VCHCYLNHHLPRDEQFGRVYSCQGFAQFQEEPETWRGMECCNKKVTSGLPANLVQPVGQTCVNPFRNPPMKHEKNCWISNHPRAAHTKFISLPLTRSKKLSVPSSVISRVIGRGGCNVNAIRDATGAHVDIDTSNQKATGTCTVTIK